MVSWLLRVVFTRLVSDSVPVACRSPAAGRWIWAPRSRSRRRLRLVELAGHPDGAGGKINRSAGGGQFAPAEAAEHKQQDQRAVPLADRIGERVDLRDGQRRPLG